MFEIDQKILSTIGKRLLAKKQTISVAESVTSGLLQFAFSSMPGKILSGKQEPAMVQMRYASVILQQLSRQI